MSNLFTFINQYEFLPIVRKLYNEEFESAMNKNWIKQISSIFLFQALAFLSMAYFINAFEKEFTLTLVFTLLIAAISWARIHTAKSLPDHTDPSLPRKLQVFRWLSWSASATWGIYGAYFLLYHSLGIESIVVVSCIMVLTSNAGQNLSVDLPTAKGYFAFGTIPPMLTCLYVKEYPLFIVFVVFGAYLFMQIRQNTKFWTFLDNETKKRSDTQKELEVTKVVSEKDAALNAIADNIFKEMAIPVAKISEIIKSLPVDDTNNTKIDSVLKEVYHLQDRIDSYDSMKQNHSKQDLEPVLPSEVSEYIRAEWRLAASRNRFRVDLEIDLKSQAAQDDLMIGLDKTSFCNLLRDLNFYLYTPGREKLLIELIADDNQLSIRFVGIHHNELPMSTSIKLHLRKQKITTKFASVANRDYWQMSFARYQDEALPKIS